MGWAVGLGHALAVLTPTHPQGRPGEICVMGPKGQKVSCGCLWGGEWVLSRGGSSLTPTKPLTRETLALSGLRGWQESPGHLAYLGPLA